MSRAFAFKIMAALRPAIRRTAEDILDDLEHQGGMEILNDFSTRVPARIIASIIGLPKADVPKFTDIVFRFSPVLSGSWTANDVPQLEQAALQLKEYVKTAVAHQKHHDGDTFLGKYLADVEEAGDLNEQEALTQLMSLIIAGSDTTRSALVIQLAMLLGHRDQWDLLLQDRSHVQNATLECLRYEPAVGSVPRFTTEDIEIGGLILPANRPCLLMTMSALRDRSWYPDPDRFDITRAQQKWHPVFGGGAHRCLGEALAKVELEESLSALLERFPMMRPQGSFPRVSGYAGIRKVEPFPVQWR